MAYIISCNMNKIRQSDLVFKVPCNASDHKFYLNGLHAHDMLSPRESEAGNNKVTGELPTSRPLSSIVCLMALMQFLYFVISMA